MTIFEAWGSVICKARKVSQSTGDIHALRDIEVAFQLTGYAHDIQIFYASGRSSIVLQDCAFLRSSCRHVWQDFAETLFMIRTHIFDEFFWNDPAEIRSGYRAFLIGLAEVRHAATTKNGPVDPSSILCYAAVTEEALFPADKTEYASFLAHLCASAYTGCEVHKSNDSCCFHLFDPFCPWYCFGESGASMRKRHFAQHRKQLRYFSQTNTIALACSRTERSRPDLLLGAWHSLTNGIYISLADHPGRMANICDIFLAMHISRYFIQTFWSFMILMALVSGYRHGQKKRGAQWRFGNQSHNAVPIGSMYAIYGYIW